MSMNNIVFWNGNKSAARQNYERDLLQHLLQITHDEYGPLKLMEDRTDYPCAKDEGAVFDKGVDILVTVAGNPKFYEGSFVPVYTPLAKGILGHRLLIVRETSMEQFTGDDISSRLKLMNMGIPDTWADADLFRFNQFPVVEKGSLQDIFQRLKRGECDYVTFGANEIMSIYETFAKPLGGLVIAPDIKLYYPFALIFYVNPKQEKLAERISKGLRMFQSIGQFNDFFEMHYKYCVDQLSLNLRSTVTLKNPSLPAQLSNIVTPSLIDR